MRVFFAIELEESLKEYLYSLQQEIIKYTKKGVFTRKDNFHITVKFMGELEKSQVLAISKVMHLIPKEEQTVEITTNGLGCFQRGLKSILWLGIEKNPKLYKLQKKLDEIIETFGYEPDNKAYQPHITLGRQIVFTDDFQIVKRLFSNQKYMSSKGSLSLMESTRVNGILTYSKIL